MILFFENNKSSWSRFPKMIQQNENDYDSIFIYNHNDCTTDIDFFSSSFCYKGDLNPIKDKLKSYTEIIVVLFAFRPIDLFFLNHIKKEIPGSKSVMIQHGVYSDLLQRTSTFSFLIYTYQKVIGYLTTFILSKNLKLLDKLILVKEIYLVYVINKKKLKDSRLNNILSLPENCLIYEEKWKNYINENFYNVSTPRYDLIPPKDLELLNSDKIIDIDSVVIIAQSLVEDGRYDREKLIQEFELIISKIPYEFKIYIKRHPRGDDSIYKNLSREIFLTDKLVIAKYIISGYSSLMQLYFEHIKSNVFSWKFKNHHNPSFFNSFSTSYGREDELINFFKIPIKQLKTTFEKIDIGQIYFNKIIEITRDD